jgi:hypothetical protein
VTKGHGRIEMRSIRTSTELNGYLDFPYAAQVFFLHRYTTDLKGRELRSEFVYGVTSLSPEKASPPRLLELNRDQWSIENKVHWVRDVTFDEDRSRIRKHAGPQVMATLRNLAISALRMAGVTNIAHGTRCCSWNNCRALRLLGLATA